MKKESEDSKVTTKSKFDSLRSKVKGEPIEKSTHTNSEKRNQQLDSESADLKESSEPINKYRRSRRRRKKDRSAEENSNDSFIFELD